MIVRRGQLIIRGRGLHLRRAKGESNLKERKIEEGEQPFGEEGELTSFEKINATDWGKCGAHRLTENEGKSSILHRNRQVTEKKQEDVRGKGEGERITCFYSVVLKGQYTFRMGGFKESYKTSRRKISNFSSEDLWTRRRKS